MQRFSLLCSSNPPIYLPDPQFFLSYSSRFDVSRSFLSSSCAQFQLKHVSNHRNTTVHTHCTATQEVVEASEDETEFVEIGFLSNVHGLQGEICVKPNTDFPELRFSKPGRRWLKQILSGKRMIQEVDLVEGRPHPGQKSWILKFKGIDTVDQVKLLVGSILLANPDDRPELERGEFYTRDLVGMKIILKETGQLVGTVVNIFNSGANDLLHVKLESSSGLSNGSTKSQSMEAGQTGLADQLVWIPFVEPIVPDIDLNRREMFITPPKGLLELNLKSDDKSKKERRQLEWRERKKLQKRLIAAKKKLGELEQQHVFDGFRFGEKSLKNMLSENIVGVNSKLLQQAFQSLEASAKRLDATEQINDIRAKLSECTLRISHGMLTHETEDKAGEYFLMRERGQSLLSEGKVLICLVLNDSGNQHAKGEKDDLADSDPENISSQFSSLQALLQDDTKFLKEEDRANVQLVLVCQVDAIKRLQMFFQENDFFGFESEKVRFLEEEKLPVVSRSCSPENQKKHKILMKSPWELHQSPIGSGGIISLLSSHNIVEDLSDSGVDYIQICCADLEHVVFSSLLLGFVESRSAELGIGIPEASGNLEEDFNVVFKAKALKKVVKQMDKLGIYAVPKLSSHVEKVDEKWVDVVPSSPNSLEFRSSIYSCFNACSADKVVLMEICP